MKKLTALAVVMSLAMSLLAGCGSSSGSTDTDSGTKTAADTETETETQEDTSDALTVETTLAVNLEAADDQDTIILCGYIKIPSFDPFEFQYGSQTDIGDLIYSPLLFAYSGENEENVRYNVVTAYEPLDDADGYLLTIREGITFSNGEALTAEDVAFSLEMYATSAYTSTDYELIDYCEVVDDTHVRLVLKQPYNSLIPLLCDVYVVAKDYYEEVGSQGYSDDPVFSGPYVIESIDDATGNIVFVRNEDYYGDPGYADVIEYQVISDSSTSAIALQNGEINVLSCGGTTYETLMYSEGIDFLSMSSTTFGQLFFNCEVEPTSDPLFRKAVAYAIDAASYALAACGNYGYELVDTYWTDVWGEAPVEIEGYEYSIEKAQELLEEGGYETPYDLGAISVTGSYSDLGVVIQQCLSDVGITVSIESGESSTWIMNLITGDYTIEYMNENDLTGDPAVGLKTFLHSSAIGETNMVRYSNEEMDELLDLAVSTSDSEEKQEALGEILQIIYEDCPALPIFVSCKILAVTEGLTYSEEEIEPDDHLYLAWWYWAE